MTTNPTTTTVDVEPSPDATEVTAEIVVDIDRTGLADLIVEPAAWPASRYTLATHTTGNPNHALTGQIITVTNAAKNDIRNATGLPDGIAATAALTVKIGDVTATWNTTIPAHTLPSREVLAAAVNSLERTAYLWVNARDQAARPTQAVTLAELLASPPPWPRADVFLDPAVEQEDTDV